MNAPQVKPAVTSANMVVLFHLLWQQSVYKLCNKSLYHPLPVSLDWRSPEKDNGFI